MASDAFLDKSKYPDVPVIEPNNTKPITWDFITWAQSNGDQKFANSIGNSNFGVNKDCKFIDSFFFYLQDKTIYFTETDKDSVVIAALKIKDVKDSSVLGIPGCFEVTDKTDIWSLCETADGEADTWICAV